MVHYGTSNERLPSLMFGKNGNITFVTGVNPLREINLSNKYYTFANV